MDDREGVAMEPIVEDEFGVDTEWMDVDLPGDSAVSLREKTLLHNMRQQLADVKMQHCSTCCERVFDIDIWDETDECQRCQLVITTGRMESCGPMQTMLTHVRSKASNSCCTRRDSPHCSTLPADQPDCL